MEDDIDKLLSFYESNPDAVDRLPADQKIKLANAKLSRRSTVPQIDEGAQQTNVGVDPRGTMTRAPVDAATLDNQAADQSSFGPMATRVARGMVSGIGMDAPAMLSKAIPDQMLEGGSQSAQTIREDYQNPNPGGYMVGAMLNPLNSGKAGLNALQAGASSAMRGESIPDVAMNAVAGGLGAYGLGKLIPKTAQPDVLNGFEKQRYANDVKTQVAADEIAKQKALEDARREIALVGGADMKAVNKELIDNPNYSRNVVDKFNQGRDLNTTSGSLGLDVSPSDASLRTQNTYNEAMGQKSAVDSTLPVTYPVDTAISAFEDAERELVKAGRSNSADRIREILEEFRQAKSAQNMGKSGAALRGSNPLEMSPSGPKAVSSKVGDVGGQQVDSAWVNDVGAGQVANPSYNLDPVGVARENQSIPGPGGSVFTKNVPIGNRMKANVGSGFDVAPSSLFEEPVQKSMSPIHVNPEDLPGGYSPDIQQSVPVSDPAMASKYEALKKMSGRETLPGQGSGGIMDRMAGEFGGAESIQAKPGSYPSGKPRTESDYIEAGNAFKNVASAVGGDVQAIESAMQNAKAAQEAAQSAGLAAAGGHPDLNVKASTKWAAATTISNPVTTRWRLLQQNRAYNAIKRIEASNPELKAISNWIESASSPAVAATRTYIAAKKNPEVMKAIQDEGQDKK